MKNTKYPSKFDRDNAASSHDALYKIRYAVLQKEHNGQVQEPSGHRSVKIKDLRVSWKWPVCNKIFHYGKGVREMQYQSQLQQSLQPQKYTYKSQYKKISRSHAGNARRLV